MHLEKIKELLQPHIPLRLGKQAVLIFPGEKSQILKLFVSSFSHTIKWRCSQGCVTPEVPFDFRNKPRGNKQRSTV